MTVMSLGPYLSTITGGGPGAAEAFPIGAVFLAVVATDPAVLLGYGTWAPLAAGRVLVGFNASDADFDADKKTGGAKTVASAGTNSAPTFTGSALGTHAHGVGSYVPSAHAGAAVADHASHTHSVTSNVTVNDHASHTHAYTEVPNHVHTLATGTTATGNFAQVIGTVDTSSGGTGATPTQTALGTRSGNPVGGVASGTTAGPSATQTHTANNNAVTSGNPSATLTHNVTQPSAHTMAGSSEAVSAGTPAGTVSAPTFTGSATSVVQPYITVRIWERTA